MVFAPLSQSANLDGNYRSESLEPKNSLLERDRTKEEIVFVSERQVIDGFVGQSIFLAWADFPIFSVQGGRNLRLEKCPKPFLKLPNASYQQTTSSTS
jgi:hypothetical protein